MPYGLKMENPNILENEDFVIYSTKVLSSFSEMSFNELNTNKNKILKYFGVDKFRKVAVILFDDINRFREYVLSLRNDGSVLPEYATGVFDKGMIISYIDLNKINDKEIFIDKVKTSVHEFIHIVNKEKIYSKRIVWLDEGLAVNLDGKRDYLNDEDNFRKFIAKNILVINELPIMNHLTHGNEFVNEKYNGYDLSYLCVRYLMETKEPIEFQKTLRDYEYAIKIGQTVLDEAIKYYTKEKIRK